MYVSSNGKWRTRWQDSCSQREEALCIILLRTPVFWAKVLWESDANNAPFLIDGCLSARRLGWQNDLHQCWISSLWVSLLTVDRVPHVLVCKTTRETKWRPSRQSKHEKRWRVLSDVVAQTESLTFSFARRLGRQSDVLAGRASTRRDEGCYPCEGVFVIFSFDCDAGFWDSVPCVMKNNDFVFFFFTDMPVSVPHL